MGLAFFALINSSTDSFGLRNGKAGWRSALGSLMAALLDAAGTLVLHAHDTTAKVCGGAGGGALRVGGSAILLGVGFARYAADR
jgi:hypothetical protein